MLSGSIKEGTDNHCSFLLSPGQRTTDNEQKSETHQMKRIAVDMDGVLADTVKQFFDWDERDFGKRRSLVEVTGKPESEAFPHIRRYVYTEGFFKDIPVMKDSQEILARINERYDLYIVSAAIEFPQSLSEKQAWLGIHFPFISWQKIVFCGSKQIIQADIMIDDHFKNLDHFSGTTTFLYSQPHNMLQDPGKHRRIEDWKEIGRILL